MKIQTTFDEIVESLELDKKMIKRFTVKDPPTGGICTIAYARRGNPSMSTPFTEGSRIVGLKGSLFDGQMDFFIHEKRGYDSLSIPGGRWRKWGFRPSRTGADEAGHDPGFKEGITT